MDRKEKITFQEALDRVRQNPDKCMDRMVMEALMERIATDMQMQYDSCLRGHITSQISDYVDEMWKEFAVATKDCDDRIKAAIKKMKHTRASAGAH